MFRRLAFAGIVCWCSACGGQKTIDLTGPADKYSMQLFISGALVDGEAELNKKLEDFPEKEDEIIDGAAFEVTDGQSYEFRLVLTDHLGTSEEFTGSDRVAYGTYGCLTVSNKGILTISPDGSSTCISPDAPQLMIAIARPDGSKLLLNQYFFRVTD